MASRRRTVWRGTGGESIELVHGKEGVMLVSSIQRGRGRFGAAVDGMESLIAALARAGLLPSGRRTSRAIQVALDAVANESGGERG